MNKYELLKKHFGYDSFREGQERLIDAILAGCDVLGVMPTGAGKSICYQIPALMLPGITLVVSPLISLMKDQVGALRQAGVAAAYLNSSLTPGQFRKALANAMAGMYKIIYVAPERLTTTGFQAFARSARLSLVAVDEAHCVSQWGHDFRPGYLAIADFVESLPARLAVAAFTATATERVRRDITALLRLKNPETLVTGFNRPNLYFEVRRVTEGEKRGALLGILAERRQQAGIVYCATRKAVEEVCELLEAAGYAATRLVSVAKFGEPIYPYLKQLDTVCNAPGSDLWHTLIEADNYHALQLLEYLYAEKIDCIYIDPPYNNRAKTWKYNNDYVDPSDDYRHSKWLSMIEKRLKIAKRLLNPTNSVLIVTIDEREYIHLGCLLEEMFPSARMQMISSVINPAGAGRQTEFSRTDEYIYILQFGEQTILPESREVENVPIIWDISLHRTM